MADWPKHPFIYYINTYVWVEFSQTMPMDSARSCVHQLFYTEPIEWTQVSYPDSPVIEDIPD